MISRYEAFLNGVALSSISPDIYISDIQYQSPQEKLETYNVAKRQGARIYRSYVEKSTVDILFEIHTYDTQERQTICQAIQRWAKNGGILKTNDRAGQQLRCVCSQKPVIDSVKNWTDELKISFSAYAQPFWEEANYATKALTAGTSGSETLYVPGSVDDAVIEVDVVPSGALTSLTLTANGRTMTLSGISVSSGSTLKVAYDDRMIQSIKVGTTSLLNKRTGADDLLAKCGENNSLSFTANVSSSVTFKVRGLWA